MLGLSLPDIDRWSDRVITVLGQNPGPFTGPGTNTYIVGTGPRRLLIDAGQGVDKHVDLLETALAKHADHAVIETLAFTHAHPDHMGGLEKVVERLRPSRVVKKPWPEWDKGRPFEVIDDGAELRVEGATLRAIATPGHARDHSSDSISPSSTRLTARQSATRARRSRNTWTTARSASDRSWKA
jgi:ribonuclease/clavin/mitogillin